MSRSGLRRFGLEDVQRSLAVQPSGEWEVVSRPVTFKQGHEVRARVQRPNPGTAHETTWPAYERVKVRRTPPT